MTALAINSSINLGIGGGGSITIATNGGLGSVVSTPTVGAAATTENFGPAPFRKVYSLIAESGSFVVSNQTCGSMDYDYKAGGAGLTLAQVAALAPVAVTLGSTPSAAANTAAIQAALDLGGPVSILGSGVLTFAPPLVINDGNRLKVSPTVEMKSALVGLGANRGPQLITRAFKQWMDNTNAGYGITLSWSAGKVLTVTLSGAQWAANGVSFAWGDYLSIIAPAGTQESAYVGVFPVISAPSGSPASFNVQLYETPLAAPVGTFTALKATTNFDVEGGRWNWDYPTNSAYATSGFYLHSMILAHAQGFKASRINFKNVPKFCICLGAVRDYDVSFIHPENGGEFSGVGNSDAVKTYGPAFDGAVSHSYGLQTDDGCSIQPSEQAAYPTYYISEGSIFNIRLSGIAGGTTTKPRVAIYPSSNSYPRNKPWKLDNIDIDMSGAGGAGTAAAISIAGDAASGSPNYGSTIGRMTIRNFRPGGWAGNLITSDALVYIKSLTIDGFSYNDSNAWTSSINLTQLSGRTDVIKFRNGHAVGGQSILSSGATSLYGAVSFEDVTAENMYGLFMGGGGTVESVNLNNCRLSTLYAVASYTVAAGGSGYAVGDVLTGSGGTAVMPFQLQVATISGGAVVTVNVVYAGAYNAKPSNAVATTATSGAGSGATFNITWTAPFQCYGVNAVSATAIKEININNCVTDVNGGPVYQQADMSSPVINLRGNTVGSTFAVNVAAGSAKIVLQGNRFVNASNGVARIAGTGTVDIYANGNNLVAGSWVAVPSGTPTLRLYGEEIAVDVNQTYYTKLVTGQRCTNTAANGTLTANQPVICNGTNWLQQTALGNLF